MPKEWMRISIEYLDGSEVVILKSELGKIKELIPIIEALNEAKQLKEKLEQLLK